MSSTTIFHNLARLIFSCIAIGGFTAFDFLDSDYWHLPRVLLQVACLAQLLLWFLAGIKDPSVLLTPFIYFAFCGGAQHTARQRWLWTPNNPLAFCGGASAICVLAVRALSYNFGWLQAFCSGAHTLETPTVSHITDRPQLAFCTGAIQWWTRTPSIPGAFCGGAFAIYIFLLHIWYYKFWQQLTFCSGDFTLATPLFFAVIVSSAILFTGRHQLAFCAGALQRWGRHRTTVPSAVGLLQSTI